MRGVQPANIFLNHDRKGTRVKHKIICMYAPVRSCAGSWRGFSSVGPEPVNILCGYLWLFVEELRFLYSSAMQPLAWNTWRFQSVLISIGTNIFHLSPMPCTAAFQISASCCTRSSDMLGWLMIMGQFAGNRRLCAKQSDDAAWHIFHMKHQAIGYC